MKRKARTSLSNRLSSLGFVALLLVSSAFFRLSDHSAALVAFAAEGRGEMSEASESTPAIAPEDGAGDSFSLKTILEELRRREASVTERENALEERLAAMRLAEGEIEKNLKVLKKAEKELRATMAIAVSAAEDDLVRLTSVYENMKPKEAASLFEEMSPEFAAGFLARMRPDAAADIMVGLEPATAYSISVIMAGRNANAPTE